MALDIDNGGEGRRDDNSFHRGRVSLDGLQNTRGTLDSGIQKVLDGILNVVVERRCGMENIVKGRVRFDSLDESGYQYGWTSYKQCNSRTSSNAPSAATSLTIT